MDIILKALIKYWYIWTVVIILKILLSMTPKINGFLGEKKVALILDKLDKSKYKVINNIMLRTQDRTVQIDHVVVSNYGIFAIETKNYEGWIIGNEFEDNWKQVIYRRKEKLHNPIKQNYGHIQALKEKLKEFPDINYISIVVLTMRSTLKLKTKTNVVHTIDLLSTINKYKEETIDNFTKEKIYMYLMSRNIDNIKNRKSHVSEIHNRLSISEEKINNNICPKCGGKLILKHGRYGSFKGCSNYPKCRFTMKL